MFGRLQWLSRCLILYKLYWKKFFSCGEHPQLHLSWLELCRHSTLPLCFIAVFRVMCCLFLQCLLLIKILHAFLHPGVEKRLNGHSGMLRPQWKDWMLNHTTIYFLQSEIVWFAINLSKWGCSFVYTQPSQIIWQENYSGKFTGSLIPLITSSWYTFWA